MKIKSNHQTTEMLEMSLMYTDTMIGNRPVENLGLYILVNNKEDLVECIQAAISLFRDIYEDNKGYHNDLFSTRVVADTVVVYGRLIPIRIGCHAEGDANTLNYSITSAINSLFNQVTKEVRNYGASIRMHR